MALFDSPTPRPEAIRQRGIALLVPLVADAKTLHAAAHFCHLNVRGGGFFAHHQFFQHVYEVFFTVSDTLSERITTLGGLAPATVEQLVEAKTMVAFPVDNVSPSALLTALFDRIKAFSVELSKGLEAMTELGLFADNNALMNALETVEKLGWFDVAHLQSGGPDAPAHV